MELDTSIEKVPRITAPYQKRLGKLGIKTVRDLFFHFPHRYEDFSNIINITDLRLNETACVCGKILEIKNRRTPKKWMMLTEAILQDKTGAIKIVWFNQPYLVKNIKPGSNVYLAGKVLLKEGGAYLSNPVYERFRDQTSALVHTGRIIPIYPETERLSSRWLRYILKLLLIKLGNQIPETLPQEIIKKHDLLPIQKAIQEIHFPNSENLAKKARQRFSFEQLFLLQLFVLKEKVKISKQKGIIIPFNLAITKDFVKSLPFKLTNAQRKCSFQILKDTEKPRPMSRLLQGDVGSGKTIVATIAALNTIKAGYQVAFMAPTEILANQHFKNISQILKNFDVKIGLLTSKEQKTFSNAKTTKISKKEILQQLKNKEIDFLIGTHALIQKSVKFANLALVILDEQHRFGTEQRAQLEQQRITPHLLSMTATPIPRTLALTIYGNLDLCLIDEMPKGRKKIITKIVSPKNRKQAYDFIRKQVKEKKQVFVICPRIEQTENNDLNIVSEQALSWSEAKAVKQEYAKLSKEIFPDLKIKVLHGKMKSEEKEIIMKDFKNKKIDILISTSVVEVGIDIPNATVMMIEGTERFGLSQLHQFRGRVGRSEHQSYCFLFTDSFAEKTRQRLRALISCENGFELAEKDLQIRGPGDFLGKRQSGIPDLAMASLKNIRLVIKTRNAALKILAKDSELKKYPVLKDRLKEFGKRIHLE